LSDGIAEPDAGDEQPPRLSARWSAGVRTLLPRSTRRVGRLSLSLSLGVMTPWSNLRQVLWAIGVFGFVLLVLGCGFDLLIGGGFSIGRPLPPRQVGNWVLIAAIAATFVYYIVAAHRQWSHTLYGVGLFVHSVFAFVVLCWLWFHIAGLLAVPFLLIGPLTWLVYAHRSNTHSNDA
jgi:hypothetical protein